MSRFSPHFVPIFILIALSLGFGLFVTWNGINYHYDAAWYLVYARGIQAGDGLSVPITSYNNPHLTGWINQWPPFYPLVLALSPGLEIHVFARIVTIGLYGASAIMVYRLGLSLTGGKRGAALVAAVLFLTLPAVTGEGFSYSRSETLFTALGLLMLVLLIAYRPGCEDVSVGPAMWAAFVAMLASLTRYVGVAYIAFGALYSLIWALSVGHLRRWHPLIAFVLSVGPLGLYALYLLGLTGTLTGTQSTGDTLSLRDVPEGVRTMLIELLHGLRFPFQLVGLRSNFWGLGAAVLVAMVLGVLVWRRGHRLAELRRWPHLLVGLFAVVYPVTFWVMGARSDIIVGFAQRHYLAVFPALILLLVSVLSRIEMPRAVVVLLVGLYVASGVFSMRIPAAGVSYNRPDWRSDPLLSDLAAHIPDDALVHTQYTSYVSYMLDTETPVRTFGAYAAFKSFACDELIYPTPYERAVFTLIDSAYLRETSPAAVEAEMRAWVAPCGTVERIANNGFVMLMTVRLD